MRTRLSTLAAALFFALAAHAGNGPYFNTYTHHMEEGEWELEAGFDAVHPEEGPWTYGQLLELEHGFSPHWASALYLLGSWEPGRTGRVDGYKTHVRYRPWTKDRFLFPVFYLEYEQFHHEPVYRQSVVGAKGGEGGEETFSTEREVEARIIFSRDFSWGNAALNLVGERNLDGGRWAFGYCAGLALKGPARLIPGAAALDPDGDGDSHVLYGMEVFGGLGYEGVLGPGGSDGAHYLQPFVAVPLTPRLAVKAAYAFGLKDAREDRARVVLSVRLGKGS